MSLPMVYLLLRFVTGGGTLEYFFGRLLQTKHVA
jgi:hypothetical protein